MADFYDQDRPDENQDQTVEIKANLVSGSEAVLRDFSASVDRLGVYLSEVKSVFSSMGQAQGAANLAGPAPGAPEGRSSGLPSQGASFPATARPGQPYDRSPLPGTQEWADAHGLPTATGGGGSQPPVQGPPNASPTPDPERQPGRPSSNSSSPRTWQDYVNQHANDRSTRDIEWEQLAAERGPGLNEPYRLAQFGENQIDEKLRIFSGFAYRHAARAQARNQNRVAEGKEERRRDTLLTEAAGRTGKVSQYLSERAAPAVTLYRDLRALGNAAGVAGPEAAGVAAGYERGDTLSIGPFGRILPNLTGEGATREGLRQNIVGTRIGMQAGISMRQGNEIVQTLAAQGFTGDSASRLATDFVAPLVKQGQDIGLATEMMTKGIRNGQTSMEDMAKTLDNMGASARAAKMSLADYQRSIDQFAESLQAQGTTYAEGVQGARNMTAMTGLNPVQTQQVTSSPMIQMGAMQLAGGTLLPSQVGTAMANNPVFAAQSMRRGIDIAMQTVSNLPAPTGPNGQPLRGLDLREARVTQAAQTLGISKEVLQNQLDRGDQVERAAGLLQDIGDAESASNRFNRDMRNLGAETETRDGVSGLAKTRGGHVKFSGQARREVEEALETGKKRVERRNPITGEITGTQLVDLTPQERERYETRKKAMDNADDVYRTIGHTGENSFDKLEKRMQSIAPKAGTDERKNWDKDLADIGKLPDNADKAKRLREMVEARMKTNSDETEPAVKIGLTAEARKFFKKVTGDEISDRDKQEGKDLRERYGAPLTAPSAGTIGPVG